MNNILHKFFNHKSDANKYLTAEQQEDLEKDFNEWLKTGVLHGKLSVAQPNNAEDNVTPVSSPSPTGDRDCEELKKENDELKLKLFVTELGWADALQKLKSK